MMIEIKENVLKAYFSCEKYATTYCELMPYLCFRQSNVNYNLIEIMR